MTLAFVGPTYPFRGGIAHHTSLLVRSLRTRHSVHFFSFSRQYPRWLYPGNGDRDPSVRLITHEPPDQLFDALKPWEWRRTALQVAQLSPGLVILPWSTAYWSPFYWCFLQTLKRAHGPKTLFICHNVVEHEASRLKCSISRRVLIRGDHFIVHSEWNKQNLIGWLGAPVADRVRVCAHPVYTHLSQPALSKAEARALLGIRAERVLLFFGFIREYKGLRYLLESLPLVPKEFGVHLVIAGERWEGTKIYEETIQRLKLFSSVTFVPRYVPNEEVARYFAAADLVIAPYITATQSGIVQLAYGFEKPVVVGKVGGLPEAVEEGKTGYLVPPRDPEAIARAVTDFYQNRREPEMVREIQSRQSEDSWDRLCRAIEFIAEESGHP